MTLFALLTLAIIITLSGIALREMARWENSSTHLAEALALAALRALVTFQVYACGAWVVTKALSTLARWWAPVTIGV
jgi:hypothetical protein